MCLWERQECHFQLYVALFKQPSVAGSFRAGLHSPMDREVKNKRSTCQLSAMEKRDGVCGREEHMLKEEP